MVRAAARAVRAACEEVGLTPFIQTSGSRGYHVVMPLQPGPDVEVVQDFAAELALLVAARDPDRLSVEWRKAKRGTAGCCWTPPATATPRPWSPPTRSGPGRRRRWPPRSTGPSLGRVEPRSYTVTNLRRRLARKPDPWAAMAAHAAAFDPVRSRLDELLAEAGRPG